MYIKTVRKYNIKLLEVLSDPVIVILSLVLLLLLLMMIVSESV